MSTPVMWQLHPVPTFHNHSKSNLSLFITPTISRKSPRKLKIGVDELVLFQPADKIVNTDLISYQNSPENFTFKRLDNKPFSKYDCVIQAFHGNET